MAVVVAAVVMVIGGRGRYKPTDTGLQRLQSKDLSVYRRSNAKKKRKKTKVGAENTRNPTRTLRLREWEYRNLKAH